MSETSIEAPSSTEQNLPYLLKNAHRAILAEPIRLLLYYLAFLAISVNILVPLSTLVIRLTGEIQGRSVLTNGDLQQLVTTPAGLLLLILVGGLGLALVIAEYAGVLWLIAQQRRGAHPRATHALLKVLRNLPSLLELGLRAVAHQLFLLIPAAIVAAIVYFGLLSDYDINYLVQERPPVWTVAMVFAALIVVYIVAINVRVLIQWSFAVPLVILDEAPPRDALPLSRHYFRFSPKSIRRNIVAVWIVILAAPPIIGAIAAGSANLFMRGFNPDSNSWLAAMVLFVGAYLIAIHAARFYLVALQSACFLLLYETLPGARPEVDPDAETPAAIQPSMRLLAWSGVAVLAVGILTLSFFQGDVEDNVLVTAHRGSSLVAPENTLSAIRQAIEDGADVVEIDVQETRDGTIILIHDEDFLRIAGDPRKLWDVDYAQVRDLDIGSWFDPKFASERLPTLEQALDVANGHVKLNIELKVNAHEQRLSERVVEILTERDALDRVVITSLNLEALKRVRAIEPDLDLGYILIRALGNLARLDVDFYSVPIELATPLFIGDATRLDRDVHVWTVNEREDMQRLIIRGADSLITDKPADARALLNERAEMLPGERALLALQLFLTE